MASLAPRRSPARQLAEHNLEKALDAMHVSCRERQQARDTFKACLDRPRPLAIRTAYRRALQAAKDSREASGTRSDETTTPA